MNPIYKFSLSANGTSRQAYPVYGDSLSKEFDKVSNQEFFRASLSGQLTFVGDDFNFIHTQAFDTQFTLVISISYDGGSTWATYWTGTFWKTDCTFDLDSGTIIVTPEVLDQYNNVLAGLEKEFNLIELAPEIVQVKADKRPMIQVYVPGQTVIGCFLSGMWWEQECEAITSETDLVDRFKFALNKTLLMAEISGSVSPSLPDIFTGAFDGAKFDPSQTGAQEFTNGNWKFVYAYTQSAGGTTVTWSIVRVSDNTTMWRYTLTNQVPPTLPTTITLYPVSGSGATGNVTMYLHEMPVYSRWVCDTQMVGTSATYPIPSDDPVADNRNYTRIIGYYFPDTIYFSTDFTYTPNQWGIYQPGQYYEPPYLYWHPELYPIARNAWGRISIWFTFSLFDATVEETGRQPFTIRHAYPISSVISVLLAQIAPGVTHQGTTTYSAFLYGINLIGINQRLFITPKSNIVSAGYDQPAQKAPITLKDVMDMLRDCFRCYWFIDDQNRFRIEHIQYFRNGGSYSGSPSIGTDLTTACVPRNGKAWAFGKNQFKFDKPAMAARYQFAWMDDVTQLFEGYPIDIISSFVDKDRIEAINVIKFASDVDYILLNPNDISKDGFVLLGAIQDSGQYVLPYYNYIVNGEMHYLQNAYVAFCILQDYYAYDMPAPSYKINGVIKTAAGTKKLKTQEIQFPQFYDPDLSQLIKTFLGNGMIAKISINLSSRNATATLSYDTE